MNGNSALFICDHKFEAKDITVVLHRVQNNVLTISRVKGVEYYILESAQVVDEEV